MDAATHRRRLQNLSDAHAGIRSCMREHSIGDYLAGQVLYNLGEYPARFSITPTEYDYRLLREFRDRGVRLIQLHEDWTDVLGRFGGDKLTSHDPEGLRVFVDLVHSLGMKISLYCSTGFFWAEDPDFKHEWSYSEPFKDLYHNYAFCSPSSPEWRAYILPRLERIMDDYGVDVLYDDTGYSPLHEFQPGHPTHISPAPETPEHDAGLEDLLELVMNLAHKRGGLFKLHYGGDMAPRSSRKLYDYLWVGEFVGSLDGLRLKSKNYEPYVVPGPDLSSTPVEDEDELYIHFVPYMQFPLRVDGRPATGERAFVEGVEYTQGDEYAGIFSNMYRYYQDHPDAPPMYEQWDSFPGRAEGRLRWLHHYDLYQPMVKEGTHVWIELSDTTILAGHKTDEIAASLFVNDDMYLVIANYGRAGAQVTSPWTWEDRESGYVGTTLPIPPRKLLYLRRVEGRRTE